MNWDNQMALKFLKLYEYNACIWDPRHRYHKNRKIVNNSWLHIQANMGVRCSIKELKKKKESLMSAYRGYKGKIKKTEMSATDPSEIYKPMWYAFPFMDSFLAPVYSYSGAKNPVDMIRLEETPTSSRSITENKNNTNERLQLDEETGDNKTNSPHESDEDEEQEYQDYLMQPSTSSSSPLHHNPSDARLNPVAFKRKCDPLDFSYGRNHMDQSFQFMKNVYHNPEDDDECSVFGTLISKKLRRLPEERRDVLMVQINQLFVDERSSNAFSNSSMMPSTAENPRDYVVTVKESTSPTWHQNEVQFVDPNAEHESTDTPKRVTLIKRD